MPETKAQFNAITKARTSLWIGLWVPLEIAKTIALPTDLYQTSEPPDELHLTLAMCGDVTTLGEEAVSGALEALKVYAKGAAPVEGAISGIGRFNGEESDVLYASYDSPDLPAFRQALVEALEHVGVPPLTDHGFSPHITLAYVEKGKGANLFPLGTVTENIPIRFGSLRIGVGGTYYDYALEGRAVEKADKVTNFPGSGDNQKISLSNSKFPQFPYSYAQNIKENNPEVWSKGGNEFGNQAFELWGKARGGDDSEAVQNWIKRRERFMNRHQNDFQLAGVVAVMKWGGVVNKGLSHMKATMNDAKEKTEKGDTWKRDVEISKTDDEQQLVFGWLSVAIDKEGKPVLDLQGDVISTEELEKAAYEYVLHARGVGEMHQRTEGVGRLVESMVFTQQKQEAMGIPSGTLPETAWWIGYKIDDPGVWQKIKSGEYRAFSIGGRAKRKPAEGGEA